MQAENDTINEAVDSLKTYVEEAEAFKAFLIENLGDRYYELHKEFSRIHQPEQFTEETLLLHVVVHGEEIDMRVNKTALIGDVASSAFSLLDRTPFPVLWRLDFNTSSAKTAKCLNVTSAMTVEDTGLEDGDWLYIDYRAGVAG